MKTQVWKKGVINTLIAGGTQLGVQAATAGLPKMLFIASDAASAGTPFTLIGSPSLIFPPIPVPSIMKIEKIYSQQEIPQVALIGYNTTAEAVVVNTRYKIIIGNQSARSEGVKTPDQTFSYTTPAVTLGSAAIDLENLYTVFRNKINARAGMQCTAYLMYKMAYTAGGKGAGSALNFTIGEKITQALTLATAYVGGCTITANTFLAGTATGFVYLYNISSTWTAVSAVCTATISVAVCTIALSPVANGGANPVNGLVIVDNPGYYPSSPTMRRGPSAITLGGYFANTLVTNVLSVGISTPATEVIKVGATGTVGNGVGARLLSDVPSWNEDMTNAPRGDASFVTNMAPVAGTNYTQVNIHCSSNAVWGTLIGAEFGSDYIYTLYIQEDSGLTINTVFLAGLGTITGIVPTA